MCSIILLPSSDKHSSEVSFDIQRISSNLRILLKLKNNLCIGNDSKSHLTKKRKVLESNG